MDLSWTAFWHLGVYAIALGFGFALGWTIWNLIWTTSNVESRVAKRSADFAHRP